MSIPSPVFLLDLILPSADPGPTSEVARPFPIRHLSSSLPPALNQDNGLGKDEAEEDKVEVGKLWISEVIDAVRKEATRSRLADKPNVIILITEKTLVSLQKFVDSICPERIRVLIVPYTQKRLQMYHRTKEPQHIL
jgi:hypothetical protein